MRLLDTFCKAGGATKGYQMAGFEVVGVDIEPQPHYCGDAFIQADALDVLYALAHGDCWPDQQSRDWHLDDFDAIHASPPCQRYSTMSRGKANHPDLYAPTQAALLATGKPWVIENVIGAPYDSGIVLCGSMFGLTVRRHRNFETSWLILQSLRCNHKIQGRPITVTGHGGGNPRPHSWKGVKSEWPEIMGMPWATPEEVTQAIPPAYTEFIGQQLQKKKA